MPRGDERPKQAGLVAQAQDGELPVVKLEPATALAMTMDPVEAVEKLAQLHRALRVAALRVTRPVDWHDYDGTPYLVASGCDQLRSLFLIRERNVEVVEIDSGGKTTAICRGEVCSMKLDPEGWIYDEGTAESDDPFLTGGGKWKADAGSLRKKAITNWRSRAYKRVLGLSNLTWAELEPLGIKREQVQTTSFAKATEKMTLVSVAYKDKEKLRELVKAKFGIAPRWNAEQKRWEIPEAALQDDEIKALIGAANQGRETENAVQTASENLFDGGKNDS